MKYRARAAMHTVHSTANGKKADLQSTSRLEARYNKPMFISKYSCQSIQNHWCKRRPKGGSNLYTKKKMAFVHLCGMRGTFARTSCALMLLLIHVRVFFRLPGWLAGCHVVHLLLSFCLTLGLSWISLGPRWQ